MLKIKNKNNSCNILASNTYEEKVYFDIPRIIAEYGTKLLWGQGYNFTHKEEGTERLIIEMLKKQKAEQLFPAISNILSLYGRCLVVIDFIGNQPKLTIADPILNNSKTAYAFTEMEGSVFWYRPFIGDLNYSVKVLATKTENRYVAYNMQKEIQIRELNIKLPKEKQLPESGIWKHNLGFVPVVEFYNKPRQFWIPHTFNFLQLADCYNVRDLSDAINSMISELIMESYMSHSRAYGSFSVEYLRRLKQYKQPIESALLDRLFVNTGLADKTQLQIQKSTFDGQARWEVINNMFDRLIREVGYSPASDTASEKTATETLFTKSGDVETTKQKRNLQQAAISELIAKCLVIMGVYSKEQYEKFIIDGDQDWTFEIKENMVLNAIQQSEQLFNMFSRDQISFYEMIAKLRDIDIEEAETVAEEILKVNNEIKTKQLEVAGAMLGEGGEGENPQQQNNEANGTGANETGGAITK